MRRASSAPTGWGLARERGDFETVVRIFGSGLAAAQGPRDWMSAVVARAEVALGREAEARRRYEEIVAPGLAAIPRNLRWVSTLTELAQLCADLGDTSRAGELEALLGPVASLHGVLPVPICYGGPVSHALARLAALQGRLDEADELFEEACSAAEALAARPTLARLLAEHAALLARRGRHSAARSQLARLERGRT